MGTDDSIRAQLDASRKRLERQRELLGDRGIDPSERARRCHEHAAGVHREAADLHQRAADLFEAHAVEFSPTKPLRAKSARRLADEERRLSAVERDAANREQAEADGLEDLGDPRHGCRVPVEQQPEGVDITAPTALDGRCDADRL